MVIRDAKANAAGNPGDEPRGSKVSEIARQDDSANDEIRSMVVGGPEPPEDGAAITNAPEDTPANGEGEGGPDQGQGNAPEEPPAGDRSLLPDVAASLDLTTGAGPQTAIDAMRTQGATPEAVDALADVIDRLTDQLKDAFNPNR